MFRRIVVSALFTTLAACGAKPAPVAYVPPPPVVAAPVRPQFNLTGIVAPQLLTDGTYLTPNRTVSPAGAIWHLRAGLNVAALACRGPQDYALAGQYNALIAAHRAELARAQAALTAEQGGVAGHDDAMTRLYNYYALPPAQPEFCRAAAALLAEAGYVPAGSLAPFALAAMPRIDAPFVAVFRAADAWRNPPVALAAPQVAVDPTIAMHR